MPETKDPSVVRKRTHHRRSRPLVPPQTALLSTEKHTDGFGFYMTHSTWVTRKAALT